MASCSRNREKKTESGAGEISASSKQCSLPYAETNQRHQSRVTPADRRPTDLRAKKTAASSQPQQRSRRRILLWSDWSRDVRRRDLQPTTAAGFSSNKCSVPPSLPLLLPQCPALPLFSPSNMAAPAAPLCRERRWRGVSLTVRLGRSSSGRPALSAEARRRAAIPTPTRYHSAGSLRLSFDKTVSFFCV